MRADHDVTLKELIESRLEGIEQLAAERDKSYTERDKDRQTSVDKALTAAKEQTASSFLASKEAILKAEEAQRAYNSSHNDLARKMDEQNKATMPRSETESRFQAMEEKITEIRTTLGAGQGLALGTKAVKDESRANLAIVVSLALFLLAGLTFVLKSSGPAPPDPALAAILSELKAQRAAPVQAPVYFAAPQGTMVPSPTTNPAQVPR